MRCAWMIVSLAACWHSSPPPAQPPIDTPTKARPPEASEATGDQPDEPATTKAALPSPSAPLQGRLQIRRSGMCGGARRPPDYRPPPLAPVPDAKLNVTAGSKYDGSPPLAQLTTAADGMFSAKLPAGTYCITFPRGPKPTQAGKYSDLDCLVDTWAGCDAVVEVPVKKVFAFDYYQPCSWSVCYHGPPPP